MSWDRALMDLRRTLAVLTLAGLCLVSSAARAENHFLAELGGGLASPLDAGDETDFGPGLGLTLGVGGRLKGLTPAWYLVGRLGYAGATAQGPARFGGATLERSAWEVALGGRMYLSLVSRLRLVTELAYGQAWEITNVTQREGPTSKELRRRRRGESSGLHLDELTAFSGVAEVAKAG